jgi:hypothetical protein
MTAVARLDELVARAARLRSAGVRVYVAATGAGAGIQDVLWRVPGCSSFLVGATFPYDAAETSDWLGFQPKQFASEETALELAMAAHSHALDPNGRRTRAVGLGVTASVASLGEHRGEHRVHVAVVTPDCALGRTIVLPKGSGAEHRRSDGDATDELALRALFDAAGVGRDPTLEDWTDRARTTFLSRPYWDAAGKRHEPSALPEGMPLYPGAFDPPHAGHFALATLGAQSAGAGAHEAVFAVCATPPHKESLSLGEMLRRAKLLRGHARLFTEGDALFIEKARRFPGRTFIVGVDALARMLDPRWGTEISSMLEELRTLGTRFCVFGRLVDGHEVAPEEVFSTVPGPFREMFVAVPGRWDVSSSELRARAECAQRALVRHGGLECRRRRPERSPRGAGQSPRGRPGCWWPRWLHAVSAVRCPRAMGVRRPTSKRADGTASLRRTTYEDVPRRGPSAGGLICRLRLGPVITGSRCRT